MKYLVVLTAVAVALFVKLGSGPDGRLAMGGNGLVWTGGKWERE